MQHCSLQHPTRRWLTPFLSLVGPAQSDHHSDGTPGVNHQLPSNAGLVGGLSGAVLLVGTKSITQL